MSLFDTIYSEVLKLEGGSAYTNDKSDRGGKTRYGITEKLAREHGYKGDMKDLPEAFAYQVYKEVFWDANRLDDVAVLSPAIAREVYDSGVNAGSGRAARWLQRTINALNYGPGAFPDLVVDGQIGRASINGLKSLLEQRKRDGETVILRGLNGLQATHYLELSEADVSQRKYTFGWLLQRVQGEFK